MSQITDAELNSLECFSQRATPAPWGWEETDDGHAITMASAFGDVSHWSVEDRIEYDHGLNPEDDRDYAQWFKADSNVNLIVLMRNCIDRLIADYREARQEAQTANAKLEKQRREWRDLMNQSRGVAFGERVSDWDTLMEPGNWLEGMRR